MSHDPMMGAEIWNSHPLLTTGKPGSETNTPRAPVHNRQQTHTTKTNKQRSGRAGRKQRTARSLRHRTAHKSEETASQDVSYVNRVVSILKSCARCLPWLRYTTIAVIRITELKRFSLMSTTRNSNNTQCPVCRPNFERTSVTPPRPASDPHQSHYHFH